ncbi:OB-fold nucleic acid binding domain-containing protein [Novosphingobium sp. M1R2S20]|uniref:OB-fold nucleic acid binding domain-containing protein n=1 Tax=Novosphingobium rhizovicinum TaxID=3228928 RepID=A0ABV3RD60_9SPHN
MQMRTKGALVLAGLLAACGQGSERADGGVAPDAVELATNTDGDQVILDGRIVSAGPSSFILDHGAGRVTVEMDDWDAFKEGNLLKAGDRAVVTGRLDERFLGTHTVEARRVYLPALNTAFLASAVDEEAFSLPVEADPAQFAYTGWVLSTQDQSFTMGTDAAKFEVDVSRLRDNPLDDEGYQKVEAGERAHVWGDFQFAEGGGQLIADGVISLSSNSTAGSPTTTAATGSVQPSPGVS